MDPDPYAGIYRGRYLDPCPPSPCNQAATWQRCRRGRTDPPEVPGDRDTVLPDWIASLGQRPVVYLSLGTVPLFNQPHTFVTLLAELAHDDVDLVVTVGQLNDPATLGTQPANVHINDGCHSRRCCPAATRWCATPVPARHSPRRLRPTARTRSPRR